MTPRDWWKSWTTGTTSGCRWGLQVGPGGIAAVACDMTDPGRPRVGDARQAGAFADLAPLVGGDDKILLLPADDYAMEWVDAPPVKDDELSEALRWALQDRMEWNPEEVSVSGYRLAELQHGRSIALAVATPRERIRHWVGDWQRTSRRRLAIDVPEQALRNLASLASGDACVGLLHVSLDASLLVVVRAGAIESRRRLNQHHRSLADPSSQAFESFVLDVQRTLDAHGRLGGSGEIKRLWISSVGDTVALSDQIDEQLSVRCEPFDIANWLDWKAPLPLHDAAAGQDFTYALGAALR